MMRDAPDPLNVIWSPDVIREQQRRYRMAKPPTIPVGAVSGTTDARAWRREFRKYVKTGQTLGALDGAMLSRLRTRSLLPSAHDELMTLWFFGARIGAQVVPCPVRAGQRRFDFIAMFHSGQTVAVEVKTLYPIRTTQPFPGNDRAFMLRSLEKASKQLPKPDNPGLIVLTGEHRLPACFEESGIIETLWESKFFSPGKHTRVSAVATLTDWYLGGVTYHFRVYHNPHAAAPFPLELFGNFAQVVMSKAKLSRVNVIHGVVQLSDF